jgi:hypothetical protein
MVCTVVSYFCLSTSFADVEGGKYVTPHDATAEGERLALSVAKDRPLLGVA